VISRMSIRLGCRRAAAGVVGCLLVGGTFAVPPDKQASLSIANQANAAFDVQPLALVPTIETEQTLLVEMALISPDSRAVYKAFVDDLMRPVATSYVVQPGDTTWKVSSGHDTDLGTLLHLNPDLDAAHIVPGQELKIIPGFRGAVHTITAQETLEGLALQYDITADEIQAANNLPRDGGLPVGETLLLPGARIRAPRAVVASRGSTRTEPTEAAQVDSAPPPPIASGGWAWPIVGGLHSSEFGGRWGGFHNGLDIAVPTGTQAVAAKGGTVIFAGWYGGYGFCVIIDHGDGVQTKYGHASSLLVSQGQTVNQGDPIILVGSTGNSTGPHLHFEVLVYGQPQNPRNYLP
jgi:murein DD-endopeptidase MepM/ murein hydrolase activator NlpD